MDKQNKILLGILSFIVACTIGYALFSETITINGTATAKGDWEITTTCGVATFAELEALGFDFDGKTGQASLLSKNATASCSNNSGTFSVELTAPSGSTMFYVKMLNTGTIPYVFNSENFFETSTTNANSEAYSEGIRSKDANHLIKMSLDAASYNGTYNDVIDTVQVEPGEYVTMYISASWNSEDTTNTGKNESISGTFSFNLEQVTAQ